MKGIVGAITTKESVEAFRNKGFTTKDMRILNGDIRRIRRAATGATDPNLRFHLQSMAETTVALTVHNAIHDHILHPRPHSN